MTQKNEICGHFLGKNKFFEIFASTLTRFFFSKFKIFKNFFIQPPKFIPYTNFKHQKWKLHGGFIIVPLPYWTGRASKQAASWFLPPLVFLGLSHLICWNKGDTFDLLDANQFSLNTSLKKSFSLSTNRPSCIHGLDLNGLTVCLIPSYSKT